MTKLLDGERPPKILSIQKGIFQRTVGYVKALMASILMYNAVKRSVWWVKADVEKPQPVDVCFG